MSKNTEEAFHERQHMKLNSWFNTQAQSAIVCFATNQEQTDGI